MLFRCALAIFLPSLLYSTTSVLNMLPLVVNELQRCCHQFHCSRYPGCTHDANCDFNTFRGFCRHAAVTFLKIGKPGSIVTKHSASFGLKASTNGTRKS